MRHFVRLVKVKKNKKGDIIYVGEGRMLLVQAKLTNNEL